MKRIITLFALLTVTIAVAQTKNALYYNKEGWSYLEKRQAVQALASFKSAVSQNKDYKDALTGLGYAYLLRHAADDAFEIFNDLIQKYPDDEKIRLGRAAALTELSRFEEALRDYGLVTEKRGENSGALYGTAYLYYRMGRNLQAKRVIEDSLRVNPYHYDTLLLSAKIDIDEHHLDDAEEQIQKAINVRQEFPDAYMQFGKLLLYRYMNEGSPALLSDSREEFNRAISINPNDTESIKMVGMIDLLSGNPSQARDYYEKAFEENSNDFSTLYNLGYSYELLADYKNADNYYVKAGKLAPEDTFMHAKMQNFLLENNFAFGNPRRVGYSKHHYSEYQRKRDQNLSDYALMHLRYAIRLNPMDQVARKELADFYNISGFNRLYINELKVLQRLHPSNTNREALNLAVIKRRDRLYNRAGYTLDMPQRNIFRVLVVPFHDRGDSFRMFDSGTIFSDNLDFTLSQFGRTEVITGKERSQLLNKLSPRGPVTDVIVKLSDENIDYIVNGFFTAGKTYIDAEYQLINNQTGAVSETFTYHETGFDALNRINYRAARDISQAVPLRGTILKFENGNPLINLGLYDSLEEESHLYVYSSPGNSDRGRKIIMRVDELGTYLCTAVSVKKSDADMLTVGMNVYELKKRKSRLIR
ncbi:MAG: tetratricopeptide repeat protein [Spirochaetes bacterium]|jgi:tetratricopeptide (TPR) repeat protein|nr:tetratricopeptide repeat protein [Spirochaetota bacterium]